MLAKSRKNNIKQIIGFELTDTQLGMAKTKKLYFFRDKIEYKIQIFYNISIDGIKSLINAKKLKLKELNTVKPRQSIILIYEAPTPALYHIDRNMYRWSWSVYDLNTMNCIYQTNNKESPDTTSYLFA
jgi:hypothetical protein